MAGMFARSLLGKALAAVFTSAFLAGAAQAVPLFVDNFESGLGQWSVNNHGTIVVDPLSSTNHALRFTATMGGGDIFTPTSPLMGGAGSYHLIFDILGTCPSGNCGGFIGINQFPGGELWITGDANYPTANPVLNNQTWQHFDFTFTATGPFQLKVEDFTTPAMDVYFDNICITQTAGDPACSPQAANVPEPVSLGLLGLGLLGIGFSRRRMLKTA